MATDCSNKLYKIRPVFEVIVDRWQALYVLREHIATDEDMIKWRGRLFFCIYNKDKPTKYGIKAFILADSNSSYCWNMDVFHHQRKSMRLSINKTVLLHWIMAFIVHE